MGPKDVQSAMIMVSYHFISLKIKPKAVQEKRMIPLKYQQILSIYMHLEVLYILERAYPNKKRK